MDITTIQKYIHVSPRKLRLVADLIREMEPVKALAVLRATHKYAAGDLVKAMETVLANTRQAGLDIDKVNFKKLEINESMSSKRFRAGTRGRAKPYKKRMSHIKIVLTDQINQKNSDSRKVSESENQTSGTPIASDKSGTQSSSESSEKKKEIK